MKSTRMLLAKQSQYPGFGAFNIKKFVLYKSNKKFYFYMYGNDINAITIDKILFIKDGMCRGNFVLNWGQVLIQCLPKERSQTRGFLAIVDISLVLRVCLVVFECVTVK